VELEARLTAGHGEAAAGVAADQPVQVRLRVAGGEAAAPVVDGDRQPGRVRVRRPLPAPRDDLDRVAVVRRDVDPLAARVQLQAGVQGSVGERHGGVSLRGAEEALDVPAAAVGLYDFTDEGLHGLGPGQLDPHGRGLAPVAAGAAHG